MKRIYLTLYLAAIGMSALAQSIKWGDEFKLRKGSTDLRVIAADNTGVYLEESHSVMSGYYVFATAYRESASLVKVGKNLNEVYRNDFNRELRGKTFEQFFACQDKLFLFSTDYSKRDRTLSLYASAVNKNTGELTSEWREVAVFQLNEKNDDVDFKIDYNVDSTKMLIVSSMKGTERNEYKIQELDKNLKASKPLVIRNEFESKKYQLEDVLYTTDRKVVLVARMYEYEEGRKKKEKFLDFTNYNIRIYNEKGKQQAEINTGINGKRLTNTKLVQERNKDLVLAGFYSNQKKGGAIDGLLVQRINLTDGKVISTSDKPINYALLSTTQEKADDDDDKEESKEERKMREDMDRKKEDEEGFSRIMQFRKIFYTADNGLVILAEQYTHYTDISHSYSPASNGILPASQSTTTYSVYFSGDLMMCKIDTAGNIGWLQMLPKKQVERIREATGTSYGGYTMSDAIISYFRDGNRPFYSGFGAFQTKGNIQLLLNDNPENITITQASQKAKSTYRFGKSDCFLVNIDEISGKVSRKVFFSNTDVPTAMPRLGTVIGNHMYMVGKSDRMIGKSKIAVARISIK